MEKYNKAFKDLEKALEKLNLEAIKTVVNVGMDENVMAQELIDLSDNIRGIRIDMDAHRDKLLKIIIE